MLTNTFSSSACFFFSLLANFWINLKCDLTWATVKRTGLKNSLPYDIALKGIFKTCSTATASISRQRVISLALLPEVEKAFFVKP